MLALARALGRHPRVLLADELSLGLAPLVVNRLLAGIRNAADERRRDPPRGTTRPPGVARRRSGVRDGSRHHHVERTGPEIAGQLDQIESTYLSSADTRRLGAPMNDPGFPVFDADNHLYESPGVARVPPEALRTRHPVRRGARAHTTGDEGHTHRVHPEPDLRRASRVRASHVPYYSGNNPEGLTLREMTGQPIDCIAAFREPGAAGRAARSARCSAGADVPDHRQPRRVHRRRRPRPHSRCDPCHQPLAP